MEQELLICPFCGAPDPVFDLGHGISGEVYYFFKCRGCAAQGGWSKTYGGALMNWNRREGGVDNSPHFPC